MNLASSLGIQVHENLRPSASITRLSAHVNDLKWSDPQAGRLLLHVFLYRCLLHQSFPVESNHAYFPAQCSYASQPVRKQHKQIEIYGVQLKIASPHLFENKSKSLYFNQIC